MSCQIIPITSVNDMEISYPGPAYNIRQSWA